jgi:transcriptional regulator with XRE-family HTH domain
VGTIKDGRKAVTPLGKRIGGKLRKLRKLAGLTQIEVALALGYKSTGTISHIEAGRMVMDLDKIIAAAEFFHIHPAYIVSDEKIDDEDLEMMIMLTKVLRQRSKHDYYRALQALLKDATK